MKMEFNPTIGNVIARQDFEGNLALAVHLSLARYTDLPLQVIITD